MTSIIRNSGKTWGNDYQYNDDISFVTLTKVEGLECQRGEAEECVLIQLKVALDDHAFD